MKQIGLAVGAQPQTSNHKWTIRRVLRGVFAASTRSRAAGYSPLETDFVDGFNDRMSAVDILRPRNLGMTPPQSHVGD